MRLTNRIVLHDGIDIAIRGAWYGFHWYWQSIPLFDIINTHTKCNSVHKYGIVLFGLWLYIRIDK